jgi:hypothetical protein
MSAVWWVCFQLLHVVRVNLQAVGLLPMWLMMLSRAPLMIDSGFFILEFLLLKPHDEPALVGDSLWVPLWPGAGLFLYI